MKNLKKLVIASFMLVIAFVAVVSSTYAWFTTSSDATVKDITVGVVDAEKSILISKDNVVWGKEVDLTLAGKFTPVTLETNASGVFSKMNKLETTNALKAYYEDAEALDKDVAAVAQGESGYDAYVAKLNKKGYAVFDLYFQLSAKDAESMGNAAIAMDLINLNAVGYTNGEPDAQKVNEKAISSFRMAIAVVSGAGDGATEGAIAQIIEGKSSTATGRYGSGDQFDESNKWMSIYAQSWTDTTEGANPAAGGGYVAKNGTVYELTDPNTKEQAAILLDATTLKHDTDSQTNVTTYYEYVIEHFYQSDYATALANTAVEGYAHIRIYVWMEGWDGDNINAASNCQYTFGLKFYAKDANALQ